MRMVIPVQKKRLVARHGEECITREKSGGKTAQSVLAQSDYEISV